MKKKMNLMAFFLFFFLLYFVYSFVSFNFLFKLPLFYMEFFNSYLCESVVFHLSMQH